MFDYNSSSILCPVKLTFSLMNDNTSIFQTISCDVPAFNNQSYDVCDDVAALSFQSYSQIGWWFSIIIAYNREVASIRVMTLQETMKTYIYIYIHIIHMYIYIYTHYNLVHPDSLLEFSCWVLVPSGNQRWQWSWFPRNPLPGGSQLTLRRWHQGDTWDAKWNWSSHDICLWLCLKMGYIYKIRDRIG